MERLMELVCTTIRENLEDRDPYDLCDHRDQDAANILDGMLQAGAILYPEAWQSAIFDQGWLVAQWLMLRIEDYPTALQNERENLFCD